VIFTFNYAKAHLDFPIGYDIYNAEADTGSITDVVKVDDLTVRFELKTADSLARLNIGPVFPLPEHIWKDIADPVNYANPQVVATGPFTEVRDFSRNAFKLKLFIEYITAAFTRVAPWDAAMVERGLLPADLIADA
jgi:peptide/nickel transport system substrate-binding protein